MRIAGIVADLKGIIFDMDGLLVNSERLYWEANIQAAAEAGLAIPKDSYLKLAGATVAEMADFYQRYFKTSSERDHFIARTDALVWEWVNQGKLQLQPGVQATLDRFQAAGVRMCIASSNYERVLQQMMWATGIRNYFEFYLSYRDVERGKIRAKPAPDIYLAAAKRLNIAAANLLVFEDSATGVAAASRAKLKCIMIPDLVPATQLDRQRATMVVSDFNAVVTKIE